MQSSGGLADAAGFQGKDAMTSTDQTELAAGDVFVIETPGGGGFGLPSG
jgi:N-methylhydantoinase B/oxoprolinase/acetone carboxylase alpha subunit